ncbi:MAG TPA: hypothetical protein VL501_01445 [Pyrinomonadaceae bacterium]|nr:hypothetical protein [Pyrinomonadaceae bacterium]
MFLSNTRLSLLGLLFVVGIAAACGSKPANSNATNTAANATTNSAANGDLTKGEQPFAAKEPEVYQAEAYYTSGGSSDKYFVARSGETRRFDTFKGDRLVVTELIKDNNRYVIDHVRKIYYTDPPTDKGPKAVNPAALAFFQNTQHHEFEETGRANGQITYRAKKNPGDPDQDVTVTIEEKTGLMVHQEVKAADPKNSLIFDLKNLKLEVPDDLFQLPADYKQVTKEVFNPNAKNTATKQSLDDDADVQIKKSHE